MTGAQVTTAYVGVGSNLRPEVSIVAALDRLMQSVRVTDSSTFYRTPALNRPGTPDFLNGVWRLETGLDARALKFTVLRRIEDELGRTRTADRYAPRTIDLDLLVYGASVINDADLRVPDPDIRVRAFIACPLLELAPELVLPDTRERLASLSNVRADAGMIPAHELTALLNKTIASNPNRLGRPGGS
jgi:2-amino-4-hydroxy-6-hydroxymethyldihydropteridine diphosphokinase